MGRTHKKVGYSPTGNLADVTPDMAAAGTGLRLEVAIAHRNTTVKARTAKLPLFNPSRKTAAE